MKKISFLLNAEQLSEVLNISEFTVKKLAKSNDLPCVYINRRPHFNLEELFKHFERLEGGAA